MSANITELSSYSEHEFVLLAHGLINVAGKTRALFSLQSHICICDLGQRREEENYSETEHECCDAEVGPLDFGKVVGFSVREEDTGGEERGHD